MNKEILKIEEKIKKIDKEIKLLIEEYEKKKISKEEYLNKRCFLEKKYAKLSNELAKIKFIGIKKIKNS